VTRQGQRLTSTETDSVEVNSEERNVHRGFHRKCGRAFRCFFVETYYNKLQQLQRHFYSTTMRNSAVLDKGPVKRDTSWSEVKVVIVGMCCSANDVAKVAVGGGADAALAATAV